MNPIMCPQCQTEVIAHETHIQRLEQCFEIAEKICLKYDFTNVHTQIALNLFNELNDFIISENIERSKKATTAQIQSYKTANIKRLNKEIK